MSTGKNYSVNAQLLQNVLNYLASRPYGEVNELVNSIMDMAKSQETPSAPATQSPVLEGEVVNG